MLGAFGVCVCIEFSRCFVQYQMFSNSCNVFIIFIEIIVIIVIICSIQKLCIFVFTLATTQNRWHSLKCTLKINPKKKQHQFICCWLSFLLCLTWMNAHICRCYVNSSHWKQAVIRLLCVSIYFQCSIQYPYWFKFISTTKWLIQRWHNNYSIFNAFHLNHQQKSESN